MDKLRGVHEDRIKRFRTVTTEKKFSKRGLCEQKKIDLGVRFKKSLRTRAIREAKIGEPDKIA